MPLARRDVLSDTIGARKKTAADRLPTGTGSRHSVLSGAVMGYRHTASERAMSIYTRTAALSALLLSLNAADLSKGIVQVEGGLIEGDVSSKPGVRVFKGIPYAAPPVGDLRWKEPKPVVKWDGIRRADKFGPRCMQTPVSNVIAFRDAGNSEDCLHLNVWTPAQSASDMLPVMLWIHGGAFQMSASSEPRHDGAALASRGVILVSMNYRLGIFGFFSHPDLTKESAHHASGNYGLLDQWAALRWVRNNIKAFGGDPDRITIFGESAGSFSVSALMASPLSRDLIAGAIGESGAFFGPTFRTKSLASAEEQGAGFAASLSADLAALRTLPAEKLLAATRTKSAPEFNPIVDGYFLPVPPAETFAAGKQSRVPLLAGWNADEMPWPVLMAKQKMTPERLAAGLRDKFPSEAEALQAAYAASNDQEAIQAARELASDQFMGYSTWKWIDIHARTGGGKPVYRYLFTRVRPAKPGAMFGPIRMSELGAVHASEIEYVFGTLESGTDFLWQPEDHKLSELMQSYWTNFAKTGDPNGPALPKWGAYRNVMRLDAGARCAPETHRDRYEALDRFYSKQSAK
jgi:para-nitrobenzyl esterase